MSDSVVSLILASFCSLRIVLSLMRMPFSFFGVMRGWYGRDRITDCYTLQLQASPRSAGCMLLGGVHGAKGSGGKQSPCRGTKAGICSLPDKRHQAQSRARKLSAVRTGQGHAAI